MSDLNSCLDGLQPLARAVHESGWRPPPRPGPSRDEVVEIVTAAVG